MHVFLLKNGVSDISDTPDLILFVFLERTSEYRAVFVSGCERYLCSVCIDNCLCDGKSEAVSAV